MIFIYKAWDVFCRNLRDLGMRSIPACRVTEGLSGYLVLKHDVETNVSSAYRIAEIEHQYGHCGSYYVQAYLLKSEKNISLLQKMQLMGHEISYHHDVMDSSRGHMNTAMEEFEKNRLIFESNGFPVVTVCQHGNPVIERKGYHSNRDFFRSLDVRKKYPNIADIMVNYPEVYRTDYQYFSDTGRKFQKIHDPLNNDIFPSNDRNVFFEDLRSLQNAILPTEGNMLSIHPHRWVKSAGMYLLKDSVFKILKKTARVLEKVPVLKKIMSRYYYLAKKI